MKAGHVRASILVLGLVSMAAGACGGSGATGGGSGGTPSTSGGTTSAGGSSAPGTGGDGGTTQSSTKGTGGNQGTGGAGTGGRTTGGTGGGSTPGSGGSVGTGGGASGGATGELGGARTGGRTGGGGRATGGAAGGGATTSVGSGGAGALSGTGGSGKGGSTGTGTCNPSKAAGTNASGSGPHKVTVETNSDPGIKEGTIFRPTDLGGAEKYPIFVWGEGGCSLNGLSNATAMGEIASHGYFVVADGTPNGSGNRTMDRSKLAAMAAPLLAYIDWAVAENDKPCSAYYQSLDTTKISTNGFSCGGLMSQATLADPRITTWGVTSSGMAGADASFYVPIHTPVLFVEGGPSDTAYDGAGEGYTAISKMDVPVMWFSKDIGHGGDLTKAGGGDFTKINLAWLNWWLKGDETATGKGLLVGAGCRYCTDSAWEVKSSKVP